MATSKYLVDIFIRHQVYLERLKTSLANEFDPTLRKIDKLIIRELTEAGVEKVSDLSVRALNRLIASISKVEEYLLGEYAKRLTVNLHDTTAYEAQFAETALAKALEGPVSVASAGGATAWARAKAQPVQAVGELLEPWTKKWSLKEIVKVEAVLRNAHAQGWTVNQAVLAIRGTKRNNYRDGVLSTTERSIEALVRTAVQHVSNSARDATWFANEDIVEGVRFIATLDSRTTVLCASLDQRVFGLNEGPRPPLHIRCRSTTVPEMKESVKLIGVTSRASKGSEGGTQVPGAQSYYTWLKGQPASFQDSAIGPTRGRLLRNGGLSAEEFARLNLGRNFEPLTLDEMRKLAPEAFNRAGV